VKKPVISIVDDDTSVREGTVDLIQSSGFGVEAFQGADDFLNSKHLGRTSCLIADVRMPGMTGLELHERLIQTGIPIPTILLTAYPNEKDRERALRSGVICYLAKPYKEEDLLGCIRSALAASDGGCGSR